jgi:pilus assembly protein Flp/PilA
MTATVHRFLADEDGATAIEYGIIGALLGVGLIAAFILFGDSLTGLFNYVRDNAVAAWGS